MTTSKGYHAADGCLLAVVTERRLTPGVVRIREVLVRVDHDIARAVTRMVALGDWLVFQEVRVPNVPHQFLNAVRRVAAVDQYSVGRVGKRIRLEKYPRSPVGLQVEACLHLMDAFIPVVFLRDGNMQPGRFLKLGNTAVQINVRDNGKWDRLATGIDFALRPETQRISPSMRTVELLVMMETTVRVNSEHAERSWGALPPIDSPQSRPRCWRNPIVRQPVNPWIVSVDRAFRSYPVAEQKTLSPRARKASREPV